MSIVLKSVKNGHRITTRVFGLENFRLEGYNGEEIELNLENILSFLRSYLDANGSIMRLYNNQLYDTKKSKKLSSEAYLESELVMVIPGNHIDKIRNFLLSANICTKDQLRVSVL